MRVMFQGLSHHGAAFVSRLRAVPGMDVVPVTDAAEAAREARLADVLVIAPSFYTEAVENAVLASGRLRLLQLLSVGFDSLIGRRLPAQTIVATAGDALAPAVAEHALALLLALVRRLDIAIGNQQRQAWARAPFDRIESLPGKTAVIAGLGAIGGAIATRLRAFGVRVVGVTRSGAPHAAADEMRPMAALRDILPAADFIVLALPLTPLTDRFFGRDEITICKPGAVLINVGRGRLIDTEALADALAAGRLGGAGLDVTEPEPLPAGHRLWYAPNTIITPHYGGIGAARQVAEHVAANLERLSRGAPLAAAVEIARG